MDKTNDKKTYVLMIFACLFWSGAFIAGKEGVNYFTPLTLTFYRFFFASLIIFAVAIIRKEDLRLDIKQIGMVSILAVVGMIGYHLLFFTALKHTTVVNSSLIAATNPMITLVLSMIMIGETFKREKLFFLVLSFVGVFLTIINWDFSIVRTMSFNIGDIIMLGAVMCWATYAVFVKRFLKYFTPLKLTAYTFLFCVIYLLPFVLFDASFWKSASAPLKTWNSILYMAIFPSFFGYLIQQSSIKSLGAAKTSIFINLVPVFSIMLSVILLDEQFSLLKATSSSLIIISVIGFTTTVFDKKTELAAEFDTKK